ncbi:MAG: YihY/virulence factor BrkB family protein [Syntrophales bacterium]|nr:YihY/virulence factor BrkB family protein [Syntrophales bacterium]MDD4339899.1 YihY/virulence factor BrkB family protein [Syntrophales bacterium]
MNFIKHDVWRIRRTNLPPGKSFFLTLLRVLILSVRGFNEDKCELRASALTFYSLISIVPVAAMAFGIAKGFGFEKVLEAQLRSKLTGHEEILNNVIQFSHSLLESTKGGLLAGIGLIVLFWAVIKVLGQIEESLNDIWGIKEQRSLGRKFGDYLSLMLVCPILIILSSSVTIFVTTQVTLIMERITILGAFSPVVLFLMKLLPYSLLWGLFTFLYMFMPNTKVRFTSALLAGVVSGTIFQVVQWAYIAFQIGVAKYNAIYGSFAAFPLFLIWLQLSWLIVLYGAEVSFAHQNVNTYEFEPDALQVSRRLKKLLSLQIAQHIIQNFAGGEAPPTARKVSHELEIPIRLVNDILFDLTQSGILSATDIGGDGERGFQPARDIGVLTIQHVVDAMEQRGINTIPFAKTHEFSMISETLETFRKTIEELPANRLLKDL